MSDAENEDQQEIVFDFADEAVVADAVFPEFAQARAVEGFSDGAGVVQFGDAVAQELQDAVAVLRLEDGAVLVDMFGGEGEAGFGGGAIFELGG